MYIDTHCHLNFKAFNKDLDQVIARAEDEGVEKIVLPGAKLDSSQKAIDISQKFASCYAAIGIHPHHSKELSQLGLKSIIASLTDMAKAHKVVAIGEIGIDYYQYKDYPPLSVTDKQTQKELFISQLKIAHILNLPVIIHCREAHDDLFEILDSCISYNNHTLTGVCHCFGGDKNHLKKALEFGLFIGFDGNCTYSENQALRDLVKETPLERLVIETDAPFLAPVPYRKTRNEPSYLKYIASEVAKIHQKDTETISQITAHNALGLFGFS